MLLVGVSMNNIPLQIVVVIGVITDVGFRLTVTVNVVPIPQSSVVGVTI